MQTFIVAIEYRGADIQLPGDAPRVATCEHAYDLNTATLAGHSPGQPLRIAFPAHQRGWNTAPQAPRCPDCDSAVEQIVRELISQALSRISKRQPRR